MPLSSPPALQVEWVSDHTWGAPRSVGTNRQCWSEQNPDPLMSLMGAPQEGFAAPSSVRPAPEKIKVSCRKCCTWEAAQRQMRVGEKAGADHDSVEDMCLLLCVMQGDHLPLAGGSEIGAFAYTADFSLKTEPVVMSSFQGPSPSLLADMPTDTHN